MAIKCPYQQFLDHLDDTDENYYESLVYHKESILLDIAKTNQAVVAKKLKMHHTKLGPILHILRLDIVLQENLMVTIANMVKDNKISYDEKQLILHHLESIEGPTDD